MNRRHLLKGMGIVAFYSSFPAVLSEFLSSCNNKNKLQRAGYFSDNEFSSIEGICNSILPKTSTPGALDVQVPYFIDLIVKDCMSKEDQQLIKQGLQQMNNQSPAFTSLSSKEKSELVKEIDETAFKEGNYDHAWFKIIKKLALIGYFTSKDGMTKALNYIKVPGDYKACIPYKRGEKQMAKTFLMYW